jgi:hypothetical protein
MTAVDRAALIEAATAELPTYVGPGGALDWEKREWAGAVLDAVLPLIADTLNREAADEAECARTWEPDSLRVAQHGGEASGLYRASALVRSLLSTDSDQ